MLNVVHNPGKAVMDQNALYSMQLSSLELFGDPKILSSRIAESSASILRLGIR